MKSTSKLLSFFIAAVSSTAFIPNVSAESDASSYKLDPNKDYSYFKNLSDDEILNEYKECREMLGDPVPETVVKIGIIEYDLISELDLRIAYRSIDPKGIIFEFPELIGVEKSFITEKDASYFGISDEYAQLFRIEPILYEAEENFTQGHCIMELFDDDLDILEGTCDAYDILRYDLAVYNSQFFIDYGTKGEFYNEWIDGENILPGDANLDGKVTIADAVAIQSFVVNKDNHFLYKDAVTAADVSNTGDGITAKDALAIQRYLLGMIDSLPESLATE